nr:immunoglobulin heavy chain junction region [Mus musculus]
CARGYYSDYW